MNANALFGFLESANERPAVFSRYTARDLWTDEHTSAQMLTYHLNEEVDLSSRRGQFIDASADWMTDQFGLSAGKRIVDFGCGPGLYCARFARTGADVTGIDFSARSLSYAREFAADNDLRIEYVEGDYLEFRPEGKFDLVTMIMCDFCALSPAQRAVLLSGFRGLLADEGRIVLDVYSLHAFAEKTEAFYCEKNQLNGFWSRDPYYAFVSSFKYAAEKVTLDKYTIVEQDRNREVYNWLQYFTPESLKEEALSAGLDIETLYRDVAGNSFDPDAPEFAVVLKKIA